MDNKLLIGEAERIYKELICLNKSNKDLDTLFNEILNKNFKNNSFKVMFYLTNILAQNNYYIYCISPFELKKSNF